MAKRPVVGITTYVTHAKWSYWELDAALVPADYVRAVERAGGRAVLIPPSDDGVDETLDAVDGLIFSGGADLDPALYGQEPHEETFGIHEERDRSELALLEGALARDMPVLAICRGSQVLNIARGGDLVQHLPDVVGDRVPIKSHHHQGLARLGTGLRPSAHDEDGWVEAVEVPDRRFAVGVLWHPEAGEDARLFEALVAEAAEYRALRRG